MAICRQCGKEFLAPNAYTKLCSDACRNERKRFGHAYRQDIHRTPATYNRKSKQNTLEAINAKALAAGLSYGAYVALMGEPYDK